MAEAKEKKLPVRPVHLITTMYNLVDHNTGILYNSHTPTPCNDLNAPEAAWLKVQVEAGVLLVTQPRYVPPVVEEEEPEPPPVVEEEPEPPLDA
jgi:hypothetical protein